MALTERRAVILTGGEFSVPLVLYIISEETASLYNWKALVRPIILIVAYC